MVDIFGEYSYAKAHFHGEKFNVFANNAQVGGFTFGVGFGVGFGYEF
jgi:hypothetical protein